MKCRIKKTCCFIDVYKRQVRTSICTAARAAACSSSCALCAQAASASGAGERRACPTSAASRCGEAGTGACGPSAFWACRAKSGAAFRCARSPCAAVCFAAPASPPRTAVLLSSLFAVFALVCSPPRFQLGFFCAKTGGRVPPLSDGGALTKSENIILCASSCHPPRSPYPHCTLPHVRFSGIGQKKKPQRKTAAAVNTLYMSCKKQA